MDTKLRYGIYTKYKSQLLTISSKTIIILRISAISHQATHTHTTITTVLLVVITSPVAGLSYKDLQLTWCEHYPYACCEVDAYHAYVEQINHKFQEEFLYWAVEAELVTTTVTLHTKASRALGVTCRYRLVEHEEEGWYWCFVYDKCGFVRNVPTR